MNLKRCFLLSITSIFDLLKKNFLSKYNSMHLGMAILAIASMNPYLIWANPTKYFTVIVSFILLSFFYLQTYKNIKKTELIWGLLFCVFLIYLSALYTTQHTHKTWYLMIPASFILFTLPSKDKALSLELFIFIFGITLIPSIFAWVSMVLNIPLNFTLLEPTNKIKASENIYYFHYLGAVFQNSTVNIFPNGMTITRVAGIYDEPGVVGTFAALFLVINGFDFKKHRINYIILIGGLLSFSTAFYLIITIGTFLLKRIKASLILIILLALNHTIPYSPIYSKPKLPEQQISAQQFLHHDSTHIPLSQHIRQYDNRSNDKLNLLFSRYWKSDTKTFLFGIASDANAIYDGYSSSWKIIFTNYGLVGFSYLFLFLIFYTWSYSRKYNNQWIAYAFCSLFLLNIYQRPFVWIPSYMLLFVGGLAFSRNKQIVHSRYFIKIMQMFQLLKPAKINIMKLNNIKHEIN